MSAVRELHGAAELSAAWPVLRQLRPHLDETACLAAIATQRHEGYRIAAVFEDDEVRAVAGFRVQTMLAHGRFLYVDDLVTDHAHRSRQHGETLFAWLVEEARRLGCAKLQLDSGVQRYAAHRFYFARRMVIQGYHFGLDLAGKDA